MTLNEQLEHDCKALQDVHARLHSYLVENEDIHEDPWVAHLTNATEHLELALQSLEASLLLLNRPPDPIEPEVP